MAWLRIGDNVATHPKMSLLLEACEFDHSLKNESFGLMVSLAAVSAAHLTDFMVGPGLVAQFAPGREKVLIDILVSAGLLERVKVDERWMYKLYNDEEFIHMRTKAEVEIDRARKRDSRRHDLIIPVRVRDGDQCRWCGKTVSWEDRKSARAATIDSLTSHRESTVDTLVVACNGCNSAGHEGKERTPRPAPTPQEVYYSPKTIAWINNTDYAQENGIHLTDRQTRLDIPAAPVATTVKAAAHSAAPGGGSAGMAADSQQESSAHVAAAPERRGAPTTDHSKAAAYGAAPDRYRHQAAAGQDPWEDAPDWVTQPAEEVLGRATAPGGGPAGMAADSHQESSAYVAAAPEGRGAPTADHPTAAAPPGAPPKGNDLIKPRPDLDQVGDRPGLSGSGRVGSDRAGQVSVSGSRRRRGRRGGKRKS